MIAAVACGAMAQDELESSGVVRLYQSRLKPNQILIESNIFKRRQRLRQFQQWMLNRKADLLMLPDVTIAILIVLQLVLLVLPIIIIILMTIINVPNVPLVQLVLPAQSIPLIVPNRLAHLIIAQLVPLAHLHTFVPPVHQCSLNHQRQLKHLLPNYLAFILIPF
jgi:hypothetical protein